MADDIQVQGALINELLESQKKQIAAETRRADLEQKKVEYQQRLVERQEQYNAILTNLYEICNQLNVNLGQVAPYLEGLNTNLHTIVVILKQVFSMLVYKNNDPDAAKVLKNIEKELITLKQIPVPQIKVVGSVNAGNDANIESNIKKINESPVQVEEMPSEE